jgi:hypothetical protein
VNARGDGYERESERGGDSIGRTAEFGWLISVAQWTDASRRA